ncbi:hypothetical protein [Xanthomonas campestris]|uniref:hypothetical protein n=1 Tax=Xanthomonas campestris TaxID=339 RepID=UPI001E619992|nr:hypothetical protein [Xanthomonas campestris]MCC4605455.1 hypothetical protein [Xanthomonas campestris pv. parthenii]
MLVSLSLLLTACGSGIGASKLSSSEYLLHNISVWNGQECRRDDGCTGTRRRAAQRLQQYRAGTAGQDLETLSTQLNADMQALNIAQRAYSTEHRSALQEVRHQQ